MKTLTLCALCLLLSSCGQIAAPTTENQQAATQPFSSNAQDTSRLSADPQTQPMLTRSGRAKGRDSNPQRAFERTNQAKAHGIDPTKNHRLVGTKGEVVLIPANSLRRLDGSQPTGPINVSWQFAQDPLDFMLMRAPTMSANALLGSGGSFFLEASENGNPLRIADGTEWTVRMPADPVTLFTQAPMRFFSGARNSQGEVEWTIVPEKRIEIEPITYKYFAMAQRDLPGRARFARIDSLARAYPEKNNVVVAPTADLAVGHDKAAIARRALAFYDDPRYADTYVCSLPFMQRLALLTGNIFGQVRSVGTTHYVDERGANNHILWALDVYAEHAGEALFIADAIVGERMGELDAIVGTTPGSTGIGIKALREARATWAEQHLEKPVTIDDQGVDLDSPAAFDALVGSGLSLDSADALMRNHEDRKRAVVGIVQLQPMLREDEQWVDQNRTKLANGRMGVVKSRTINAVRFTEFGAINCDRFLREDLCTSIDVFVTLDGPELQDEDVQMLFPSINGCIPLRRDPRMRAYRLPDRFYGLPLGLQAHVVVVGKADGDVRWAMQTVQVSRNMGLRLEPTPGNLDDLCKTLRKRDDA